jgi:hypothetical protein
VAALGSSNQVNDQRNEQFKEVRFTTSPLARKAERAVQGARQPHIALVWNLQTWNLELEKSTAFISQVFEKLKKFMIISQTL